MKKLSIVFIFIQTLSFEAQNINSTTDVKKFIASAFASIIVNNEAEYRTHLYDTKIFKIALSGGWPKDADEEKRIDRLVKKEHKEYLNEQSEFFKKTLLKVQEFKINWSDIVFDSIFVSKSSQEAPVPDGCIYFRKKDNSEFYKANFKGLIKLDDRYYIRTLYVPHIYFGAKNRLLTAEIKKQYMDSCISRTNYLNSRFKSSTTSSFYGDCIPCFCEKRYVSDSEQTNGVAIIEEYVSSKRVEIKVRAK